MASGQEDNGEGSSAAGGPGAAEEWVQSMASGQEDNGEGSSAVGGPGAIQKPDSSVTERGNGKGKSRADDREANDSRDQELGSDGDSKANIQELEDDPIHPEYVQLCIKQDHLRTKLAQPDIKDKRNDKETFKSLKLNYQQYRPAWWRLTTLSHVEFKRVGPGLSNNDPQIMTLILRSLDYTTQNTNTAPAMTMSTSASARTQRKKSPFVQKNAKQDAETAAPNTGTRHPRRNSFLPFLEKLWFTSSNHQNV